MYHKRTLVATIDITSLSKMTCSYNGTSRCKWSFSFVFSSLCGSCYNGYIKQYIDFKLYYFQISKVNNKHSLKIVHLQPQQNLRTHVLIIRVMKNFYNIVEVKIYNLYTILQFRYGCQWTLFRQWIISLMWNTFLKLKQ